MVIDDMTLVPDFIHSLHEKQSDALLHTSLDDEMLGFLKEIIWIFISLRKTIKLRKHKRIKHSNAYCSISQKCYEDILEFMNFRTNATSI